jgi:hypothetical protein
MSTRAQLKLFFKSRTYPTQAQFYSLIDSLFHPGEDTLSASKVEGLTTALGGKASTSALSNETGQRVAADVDLQAQINALVGSFDMRAFISLAPVCADEAAAVTAGLTAYTLYKTPTGELRYKLPAEGEGFTYTLPLILS